jgi:hypothetical protein
VFIVQHVKEGISIGDGEFLHQMTEYQFLEMDLAAWS